jgi:superfamily II DNA or RNA helicase
VGWNTTDAEEIERRRSRAVVEPLAVEALERDEPVFGTFRVTSEDGGTYEVEVRSLAERHNSCGCPDHRVNGLGTCKHVEAVLRRLGKRRAAGRDGAARVEIFLDPTGEKPRVRVAWPAGSRARSRLRDLVEPFFGSDGTLLADPAAAVPTLARRLAEASPAIRKRVRLSRHLVTWAEGRGRKDGRRRARDAFLADLEAGKRTLDVVRYPLYDYQREGVLHLAFTERALLGDEMGLGKTVQAIAACELLRRLHGVERVLVVCPVSLKGEWEDQIGKFTGLPARIVLGPRPERLRQYRERSFFHLVNYEQVLADGDDIQRLVSPDVVILDEAQRIKNWRTKTARAVKQLDSRYAFVLTGTPLENRIDDVYSIVQFLDPGILGPLFRFNRDFYQLDGRGRPAGHKNLGELHRRLQPVLLRRRKHEVEDQLPDRTVNTYLVAMEPEQAARYEEYSARVARLLAVAKRRPLTADELDKLQRWLACMRMLCDTPYILDPECRVCPKLGELEEILAEQLADPERKVLIFSEWERMLELVRELAREMGAGFAWHTGSVPQGKRREEIRRFKRDPDCRLFLSTDSGSVGLNLQAASVVVNLDLPWNPARLEQRIARAWRKNQTRSVQVIHLVTERSIEHRMLAVLAGKQALADGVLDGKGDLDALPMPSGRTAFIERLEAIMGAPVGPAGPAAVRGTAGGEVEPGEADAGEADPLERLRQDLVAGLGDSLLLLEATTGCDGRPAVLAVVERSSAPPDARPELPADLRRAVEGGGWTLQLVDRAAWETIGRLIEAGLMQPAPGERRVLHRSPGLAAGLAGSAAEERERRRHRARAAFERGERSLRMASVLADGGFPLEALAPLAEAARSALAALAHLAGTPAAEGEVPPPVVVEALRRAEPPIPELAARALALISGDGAPAEPPLAAAPAAEALARAGVEEGRALYSGIEETLSREALGAPGGGAAGLERPGTP